MGNTSRSNIPNNQQIKEKFFFFIILGLYIFFIFSIFFINITYRSGVANNIKLRNLYTSDNKLIANNILGYVYYLNTKNANSEDMRKAGLFVRKYCPDFHKKSIHQGRYYLLTKSSIPIMEIDKLPKLIVCRREYYRHYPYGEIFSHPVGIYNENIQFGLEMYNYGVTNKKNLNKPIITTLSFPLHYILYKELKIAYRKYNCTKVHGLIQNDKGEILAMISLPSFDPIKNNKTPKNTMNGVIYSGFEFGSTIKFFSFILALHENIVKGDTEFDIGLGAKIGNHKITDVRKITGFLTVKEILRRSSNVGTILLSELIWTNVGKFYQDLMLGDRITFDGFQTSHLQIAYEGAPKYVYQHYCMGYSFRTSMLQVLRAFGLIVTGKMYNPSLIKQDYPIPIKEMNFNHKEIVMNVLLQTSKTNPIMRKYNVYGKTGTARILVNGQYIKNKINTFYMGTFIKNGKRYFLLLVFEEPHSQVMEASANVKPAAGLIINEIMKTDI